MNIQDSKYDLTGQWSGTSESGSIVIINLDHSNESLTGYVSVIEMVEDKKIAFWSKFEGNVDESSNIDGIVLPPKVYFDNHVELTLEDRKDFRTSYNTVFPEDNTHISAKIGDNSTIMLHWHSNYVEGIERKDNVILKRYTPAETIVPTIEMSWDLFKKHALEQVEGTIFRGQNQNWSLQTSMHRAGKANFVDYFERVLPDINRHTGAMTDKNVDLKNYDELGGFLNLLQHHGFPTPLLDWTYSPYVAAFFAFESKSLSDEKDAVIFIFNSRKWTDVWGTSVRLMTPFAEVTTFVLPAIGNSRALPQQALTMYSNYHDIESMLLNTGGEIKAITIPASERSKVMSELALMGITWGSIYPGLDGVCRQLKYKHFGK